MNCRPGSYRVLTKGSTDESAFRPTKLTPLVREPFNVPALCPICQLSLADRLCRIKVRFTAAQTIHAPRNGTSSQCGRSHRDDQGRSDSGLDGSHDHGLSSEGREGLESSPAQPGDYGDCRSSRYRIQDLRRETRASNRTTQVVDSR
jgi:hypothetical protein